MIAHSNHRRAERDARKLVQAYAATARGTSTSETMRERLSSVVAAMPHLFHTVDSVHVLRWSCGDDVELRAP